MEIKTSFKFPHKTIDNLNVLYNETSCMIVFWNKYQIFLINELEISNRTRQPEWLLIGNTNYIIDQVILSNNHLFALNDKGTLKVISFNDAGFRKLAMVDFQVHDHNVMCIDSNEVFLFSIKFETNKWYLKIDSLSSGIQLHSMREIDHRNLPHPPPEINRDKGILRCYMIDENYFANLNDSIFRAKKQEKPGIIVMSFDLLSLYIALVNLDDTERLIPIKLTCPSEINNITIIKEDVLNLIISLNAGTVIKRPLTKKFYTPNIAHLHTAIHKFLAFDNNIIYTDGITMWISTNTFREANVELKQLFVKNIKDFTKLGEKLICTTYSKLVYIFSLADESCYLTPTSDYSSSEILLSNTCYLHRIMEEVEKNNEIAKKVKEEENYITTLALSNRRDIMNEIMQYQMRVYEMYEDILKEDLTLNLTNNILEYLDVDSFYILLKIITITSLQQNIDVILSNILNNLNIHITVLSNQKVIKIVTFKVLERLNTLNIVFPLNLKNNNITDITVNIKIVKKIPKVLDNKHSMYTVLHCKQIVLTPENFIRTHCTANNVSLLKKPADTMENLIHKISSKHHGHLFKIDKEARNLFIWSFYIKLPNTYKEMLQNRVFYNEYFNSSKATNLLRIISSEQFLESRGNISLYISNEKFEMEILSLFATSLRNKVLRVSCANPVVAFSIRNFFSNVIHNNYQDFQTDQEFYSCSALDLHQEIQNIETEVGKWTDDDMSFERFLKIYDQYQENVITHLV